MPQRAYHKRPEGNPNCDTARQHSDAARRFSPNRLELAPREHTALSSNTGPESGPRREFTDHITDTHKYTNLLLLDRDIEATIDFRLTRLRTRTQCCCT